MLIAVPSKGEQGYKHNKILPNICTFFIPESEYHQYKGLVKSMVCAKEVRGITDKKLDFKNADEQYVVMLDDDANTLAIIF